MNGIGEARKRAERNREGFLGLWDRVSGQHARLRGQNEADAGLFGKLSRFAAGPVP
jgi:hypothetical protein